MSTQTGRGIGDRLWWYVSDNNSGAYMEVCLYSCHDGVSLVHLWVQVRAYSVSVITSEVATDDRQYSTPTRFTSPPIPPVSPGKRGWGGGWVGAGERRSGEMEGGGGGYVERDIGVWILSGFGIVFRIEIGFAILVIRIGIDSDLE